MTPLPGCWVAERPETLDSLLRLRATEPPAAAPELSDGSSEAVPARKSPPGEYFLAKQPEMKDPRPREVQCLNSDETNNILLQWKDNYILRFRL